MAKNSALTPKNKKLLYTTIIRRILTVQQTASNTAFLQLQTFQNKCLRLITHKEKYAKTANLHNLTDLSPIQTQVRELTGRFYRKRAPSEPLTKKVTSIQQNNMSFVIKYRLLHQNLDIFYENIETPLIYLK